VKVVSTNADHEDPLAVFRSTPLTARTVMFALIAVVIGLVLLPALFVDDWGDPVGPAIFFCVAAACAAGVGYAFDRKRFRDIDVWVKAEEVGSESTRLVRQSGLSATSRSYRKTRMASNGRSKGTVLRHEVLYGEERLVGDLVSERSATQVVTWLNDALGY